MTKLETTAVFPKATRMLAVLITLVECEMHEKKAKFITAELMQITGWELMDFEQLNNTIQILLLKYGW